MFDREIESLEEIIQKGVNSELLFDNPVFIDATKQLYWKLTLAEDKIIGDVKRDGRETAAESKRLAQLRALLVELVSILDNNILAKENALYNMEMKENE